MKSILSSDKVPFLVSLFVLLMLWEFIPKLLDVPTYIFPPLSAIGRGVVTMNSHILLLNIGTTALEAGGGFLIGSLFGFLLGLSMAEFKTAKNILLPYIIASNAIPVIALAPIILIWFGSGIASKVAVAAFLCFFPLCVNTFKGLSVYHVAYRELFDVYGASQLDFLIKFKLPNAFSYIFAGLRLNATFSVVGAVVAEFIGSDQGLGFGILQASYSLNVPRLWAYIIIACLLGLTFYGLVQLLERIFLYDQKNYSHASS